MADDADVAADDIETLNSKRLAAISQAAANIPAGSPGVCDWCGEESGRLVKGACAPCRERFKLE